MLIKCNAYGKEPIESDSVLKALADNRIFDINKTGDDAFQIIEMCDEYFCGTLTREQLITLGNEIIAFADSQGETL